jgi:hypothetical protein
VTDIHGRVTAAIDLAERFATKVKASPDALVQVDHCTCYGGNTVYGHEPGCGSEPGAAWYLACDVLRGLAEDRDILHRHANEGYPGFGPELCGWCSEDAGSHIIKVLWPCPEIRSLARRHGVEGA